MLEFSIHAPTRGATLCDQRHGKQFGFSIHAPTRGATVYCLRDIIFIKLFNPRSHERSDSHESIDDDAPEFSIHAPTRGATISCHKASHIHIFQSTLPREERRTVRTADNSQCFFNPRSHERSDHRARKIHRSHAIFNPRSHERSDQMWGFNTTEYSFFNPRSHERSDSIRSQTLNHLHIFNPRSHERSDSNIAQKICLFLYNTDNKYIIR